MEYWSQFLCYNTVQVKHLPSILKQVMAEISLQIIIMSLIY